MRTPRPSSVIAGSVVLLATVLAGSASADYSQGGVIDNTHPTLVAPAGDESGTCTAGNVEAHYVTKSFTARAAGLHHLRLTHNSAFPTRVIVYDGSFDPAAPLTHCLHAATLPGSPDTSHGTVGLAAVRGHVYTVVVAVIAMTDYTLEIDEPDGAAAGAARGAGTRFVQLPASLSCRRLALNATWTMRAREVRSAIFFVDGDRVDLVRRPEPRDRSGVPVGPGDLAVKATLKLTNGNVVSVRRSYLSC